MTKAHLEFHWKYKNYELRACPRHLVRFGDDEPNVTIDFVFWERDKYEKDYCFSLAHWIRDPEGYYLRFVGDRPFQYIASEDIPFVWNALNSAQKVLDAFFAISDEEDQL